MARPISPDLRPWVDLTLYDASVSELLNRGLLDATVKMPNWVPRAGHTEVVLLEAIALVVAELIYAANRIPSAVAQIQGHMADVERSPGVAPLATATFAVLDAAGYVIPAGTRLRLVPDADDAMVLLTDAELVIAAGASSGTVAVVSSEPTDRLNGTPAGTVLELLDSLAMVNSVELATPMTAGADPEGVEDWLTRTRERYARLSEVLVLPGHFVSRALEDVRVYRALGFDLYNPDVAGVPGDHPGHITVAVAGSGGTLLSAAVKAELLAVLDAASLANLGVHVVDVTLNTVAVAVTVLRTAEATSAAVVAAVQAALSEYLSPDVWRWGGTVYRNELISLVDAVVGVERVVALTTPATDVALTGVAPLTSPGVLTVTVTAP